MQATDLSPLIRPENPTRHLVGERHRHDLEGSPCEKLREPGILRRILQDAPKHGDRPDDKNAPQVAVALFGDRPELLLAPGRILARQQPAAWFVASRTSRTRHVGIERAFSSIAGSIFLASAWAAALSSTAENLVRNCTMSSRIVGGNTQK
jgi:hypothetical protein